MQLAVDLELITMLVYWFIYGTNLRYPLVMAIVGVSKILLNVPSALFRCFFRLRRSMTALISTLSLP